MARHGMTADQVDNEISEFGWRAMQQDVGERRVSHAAIRRAAEINAMINETFGFKPAGEPTVRHRERPAVKTPVEA